MTRKLRTAADRVNDKHEWFLRIAEVVATRSSCARRAVGAVIVDEVGYILSTGYNGPARGQPNCTETPCAGAHAAPGTELDACIAIHAEVNAIAQARSIKEARALYCSVSPCVACAKILSNLPNLKRVFFRELYATPQAIQHLQAVGIRSFLVKGQRQYAEVKVVEGEIRQVAVAPDDVD
ncbi:MAG: cytidine deaminase [Planctomycetes bacterium]|nr:cytidine deaminase [Planctomycetota bacterium]